MEELPIDVFIQEITYLPFSDVVSLCSVNSKLHDYCTNIKYNNHWKTLIDNTYSSVPGYLNMLELVWNRYGQRNVYNYMIYTDLIKTLNAETRLTIYYRQRDMKSFGDPIYTDSQRIRVLNRFMGKGIYGMLDTENNFKIIENNRSKMCQNYTKTDLLSLTRQLMIGYSNVRNELSSDLTRKDLCNLLQEGLRKMGRLVDFSQKVDQKQLEK